MGAVDVDGKGVNWDDTKDSEYNPIISLGEEYKNNGKTLRYANIDTYLAVGFRYMSVSMDEYEDIKAWQEEKQRTAAIVEREKAATEFYRLAIAEMKDMVYE